MIFGDASSARASCPAGTICGGPQTEPGQQLPPPSLTDDGVSENAVTRIGYSSGAKVGGALALSLRMTTWPYDSAWGIDAFEIELLGAVDRREIGWRFAPLGLVFSLQPGRRLFDGLYLRANLVELGLDYRTDVHDSRLSVGTSFSLGWSIEATSGVAIRVFEIGSFAGVYVKHDDPIFDWGFVGTTGLTFR